MLTSAHMHQQGSHEWMNYRIADASAVVAVRRQLSEQRARLQATCARQRVAEWSEASEADDHKFGVVMFGG